MTRSGPQPKKRWAELRRETSSLAKEQKPCFLLIPFYINMCRKPWRWSPSPPREERERGEEATANPATQNCCNDQFCLTEGNWAREPGRRSLAAALVAGRVPRLAV